MTAARTLWSLYEPIHAVTYFAGEAAAVAAAAGYPGFWMGYFAQRAAPLGPVAPEVVTACFYGFHRSRVERALPDAWAYAGPDAALDARLKGVDQALRRLWGDSGTASPAVSEAADLLWTAAQAGEVTGRVLGAANQALSRPSEPHLALWQATTTLREQRGDGHIATLVAFDVSPLEAALIKVAADETDGPSLRQGRGWPEADWQQAEARLVDRGLLDESGALTTDGAGAHEEIEARTDEAASSPWDALGPDATVRAAELLRRLVAPILAADLLRARNPIGVPLPEWTDSPQRAVP
ncbi:MAG: SCO6745 family protein [Nocardioides sp.]